MWRLIQGNCDLHLVKSLTNFVYQRTKRRPRWISKGFQTSESAGVDLFHWWNCANILLRKTTAKRFWDQSLGNVDTLTNYFRIFIRAMMMTCGTSQSRERELYFASYTILCISKRQSTFIVQKYLLFNNTVSIWTQKVLVLLRREHVRDKNIISPSCKFLQCVTYFEYRTDVGGRKKIINRYCVSYREYLTRDPISRQLPVYRTWGTYRFPRKYFKFSKSLSLSLTFPTVDFIRPYSPVLFPWKRFERSLSTRHQSRSGAQSWY